MMGAVDEAFGVGHHAEDSAGGIADGGDVVGGAVGVDGVVSEGAGLVDVAEGDLAVGLDGVEDLFIGEAYFALSVGDGQVDTFVRFDEDAFVGAGLEIDPAVFEFAAVVVGEGGLGGRLGGFGGAIGVGQESGFYQYLETVADADDEFVGGDEFFDGGAEVMHELVGKDFAGGDVVAVAEAAGQGEYLVFVE